MDMEEGSHSEVGSADRQGLDDRRQPRQKPLNTTSAGATTSAPLSGVPEASAPSPLLAEGNNNNSNNNNGDPGSAVPLELTDFSCVNGFETVVYKMELFLREAFRDNETFARLLYSSKSGHTGASVPSAAVVPPSLSSTQRRHGREDGKGARRSGGHAGETAAAAAHTTAASPPSSSSGSYSSSVARGDDSAGSATSDTSSSSDDDGALMLSFSSDDGGGGGTFGSPTVAAARRARRQAASPTLVVGRSFSLLTLPATATGRSAAHSVTVEIHAYDAAHPVTMHFYLPLFFLVRRSADVGGAAYPASESRLYLSLLATAVGNFCRLSGAALDLSQGRDTLEEAFLAAHGRCLPSPFAVSVGCAPCFVPTGDAYADTFIGCSPPVTQPFESGDGAGAGTGAGVAAAPQRRVSQSSVVGGGNGRPGGVAGELGSLLRRRTFSARCSSAAFPSPPKQLAALQDYIDLLQLHMGGRSHIVSGDPATTTTITTTTAPSGAPSPPDGLGGTVLSLWQRYRLSIPWKFQPYILNEGRAGQGFTWAEILDAENALQRQRCGGGGGGGGGSMSGCCHPFGTTAPPLRWVEFDFQWNQVPSRRVAGSRRQRALDPFAKPASAQQEAEEEEEPVPSVRARARTLPEAELRHQLREVTQFPLYFCTERLRVLMSQGAAAAAVADPMEQLSLMAAEDLRSLAVSVLVAERRSVRVQEELIAALQHGFECGAGDPNNNNNNNNSDSDSDSDEGGDAVDVRFLLDKERRREQAAARRRRLMLSSGDLRRTYFPGSLLCRMAHVCTAEFRQPEVRAFALWRCCVEQLRALVRAGGAANIARALDSLALPVREPPVDLAQSLIVQKLQLLAHCLRAMLLSSSGDGGANERLPLHPTDDNAATPTGAARRGGGGGGGCDNNAEAAAEEQQPMRLITNGEVLVVPPSLPVPPCTSDRMLERAAIMSSGGAAVEALLAAAAASSSSSPSSPSAGSAADLPEWLLQDTLFNDMCLFQYVNGVQHGRVVRFPDFVHWHSPRDFVAAPDGAASGKRLPDSAYLSPRMQQHGSNGNGGSHLWWALWACARPRSREEVIASAFSPSREAASALEWLLTQAQETDVLVELAHATFAAAAHGLLTHRHVIRVPRGARPQPPPAARSPGGAYEDGPPRRALQAYARGRCAEMTTQLEAVTAVVARRRAVSGVAGPGGGGALGEMELETLLMCYAAAERALFELDTAVSAAVALESLLGRWDDRPRRRGPPQQPQQQQQQQASRVEAACDAGQALLRRLSSPAGADDDDDSGGGGLAQDGVALALEEGAVDWAAWRLYLAPRFTDADDRRPREMHLRATCVAERPLSTAGCMQQLIARQSDSNALHVAVLLSQEVL